MHFDLVVVPQNAAGTQGRDEDRLVGGDGPAVQGGPGF